MDRACASDEKTSEQRRAASTARRTAKAELKARSIAEANKTKEALLPLRTRVQAFIEDYEHHAPFEHARTMERLLRGLLQAVDIGCQEAGRDLARICSGERPCQPSVLRHRLDAVLWDTQ